MAVTVDLAYTSASDSTVSDDTWTSLVGGPHTVLGLGNVVMILGYVLGLGDDEADVRLIIDGTEVVKGSPASPLMYNQVLAPGTHNVDFQAMATQDHDVVAGPRGLSILDLV